MATAQEEYIKARKLGTKEYQKALSEGRYPYLPAAFSLVVLICFVLRWQKYEKNPKAR